MKLCDWTAVSLLLAPLLLHPDMAQAGARHQARGTDMRLTSPAFGSGRTIPTRYTCSGADHSPPLRFAGLPRGTKALALTLVDVTAHGFTHWTVWNLSPRVHGLTAGRLPRGAKYGTNDYGFVGYGGPCPPRGNKAHDYVFALYAMKRKLPLANGAPPAAVKADIASAEFASARLGGLYGRR
jgi:hypothetical protein